MQYTTQQISFVKREIMFYSAQLRLDPTNMGLVTKLTVLLAHLGQATKVTTPNGEQVPLVNKGITDQSSYDVHLRERATVWTLARHAAQHEALYATR